MNAIRVSVVIVTYNGAPWIRRCLLSLRESRLTAHVIVVDNHSIDDCAMIVNTEFPEVELLLQETNLGFGLGNNAGIARALALHSNYVFLLNQDAYVLPDSLGSLADFMDERLEYGVVSPLHCSPDDATVDARTYLVYLRNFATQWLCDAALGHAALHYRIRGINAAAWMLRADTLTSVGGFDPLFFMYGEDDDLIARFEQHGVAFGLLPGTRIVHLRESAIGPCRSGLVHDIYRRARRLRSDLVLRVKNSTFGMPHMLLQLLSHGLLVPLATVLIEKDIRQFLAMIVATAQVLADIPRVRRHAKLCAQVGPHFL